MAEASRNGIRGRNSGLVLAALLLSGWVPASTSLPTLQDLVVAGHVLHFQQPPVSGGIILAIVYNSAMAGSHDEAATLAALLGRGLDVGDLTLHPRLVEQSHLGDSTDYGAVFTALGVDQTLLGGILRQHQLPCLTLHLEQVEYGSCIVAIRSRPSVSIAVNEANAIRAGVQFATAFRMMVREI